MSEAFIRRKKDYQALKNLFNKLNIRQAVYYKKDDELEVRQRF